MAKRNVSSGKSEPYLWSGLTASIKQPEVIAVTGPSGQGKSTLLRMLACLDVPDHGDMRLHGKSYRETDPVHWRKKVCYVAQHAVMLPGSVEDNWRTASRLHGTTYDKRLAALLVERAGLGHIPLDQSSSDLSGGEKQRVALIRSLMLRSDVLLLDEITASLDEDNSKRIEELLLDWHYEHGTTLVWVTHDKVQANRVASLSWKLSSGVWGMGSPSDEEGFDLDPDTGEAKETPKRVEVR
ncbi:ABC transporter ATP-binding protein [Paenibacillus sp. M.A.Huq-81]